MRTVYNKRRSTKKGVKIREKHEEMAEEIGIRMKIKIEVELKTVVA